jgi:hypothetical protein
VRGPFSTLPRYLTECLLSGIAKNPAERFGRIAIANLDAGARANINTAVNQAYRAIEELRNA